MEEGKGCPLAMEKGKYTSSDGMEKDRACAFRQHTARFPPPHDSL